MNTLRSQSIGTSLSSSNSSDTLKDRAAQGNAGATPVESHFVEETKANHATLCACGHSLGWHTNGHHCGLDGCECVAFEAACPDEAEDAT